MTRSLKKRPWRRIRLLLLAAALAGTAGSPAPAHAEGQVNVYSFREPQLIDPLLAAFTAKTGITVRTVFAPSGLVERIKAEGRNSPADLILTNESSLLVAAQEAGVTQAVKSAVLDAAIPARLREPGGHWFALTMRARVVFASRERVAQDAITYEDLADPKWKGKVCVRSGQHPYNVTLVAAMLAEHGEERTQAWLKGLKANLARKPAGGDREQVRDVFAGLCDIAVGNTYYMGAMETNTKAPEQQKWAASVKLLFPNGAGRGTHVNVSGVSLAAYAPNRDNAIRLMEFLASPEAQRIYAETNNEYPVVAGVDASSRVKGWGQLKADPRPLPDIVKLRRRASELIDQVNFDAGPTG